jgi:hypothetical protein
MPCCDRASSRPKIGRVTLLPVFYYDPFAISDDPQSFSPYATEVIRMAKHFRFAYQCEFRFVFVPTESTIPKTFKFELGSISDIAELIVNSSVGTPSGF